jgi:biopolymer transport protein ExbD
MAKRKEIEIGQELNMQPFVSFMIILASVLIACVEFAKMAFIELKLPEGRGSQVKQAQKAQSQAEESNKLLLTAIITDSVVTLGAKSGFLPTLFYREYHRYMDKVDGTEVMVEYKPGVPVKNPTTGRELSIYERDEIYLYVLDSTSNIMKCMYTKSDEMVTNIEGFPVEKVSVGDTVYTLGTPRRMQIVKSSDQLVQKSLSAYDELKNRLLKIRERFVDVEDPEDIIIAAENEVLYDKIVQIMDVSREAGFNKIAIAKLRS